MTRFIEDVKKYYHYVIYAGKAELRAEVANSYLNWLWWIIEPFCFMLVYTFIFGYVFNASEDYFPVFIFIGISMWDFFNRMLVDSVKLVRNNKSVVSKVYLPKYMLIFIKMYVNGFKMMISFLIVAGMMLFYRIPVTVNVLWFVPVVLTHMTVTFAICTFLMHFGVYVDDLGNVIKIVLRLTFYCTGIFYNVEKRFGQALGEAVGSLVVRLNPVALTLASMRSCLIYSAAPHYKWLLLWFVVGAVLSALGIRLIYKSENSYVKVI